MLMQVEKTTHLYYDTWCMDFDRNTETFECVVFEDIDPRKSNYYVTFSEDVMYDFIKVFPPLKPTDFSRGIQ